MPEMLEKLDDDKSEIFLIIESAQALINYAIDKSEFSSATKVTIKADVAGRMADMRNDASFCINQEIQSIKDEDPDYLEKGRDAEDYLKMEHIACLIK